MSDNTAFSVQALRNAVEKAREANTATFKPGVWMRVLRDQSARFHIVTFAEPRALRWHTYFAKGPEGDVYRRWLCAGEGCPLCEDARVRRVNHVAVMVFNWAPGVGGSHPYQGLQVLSLFEGYWEPVITLAEQVGGDLDSYDFIIQHNRSQPTYSLTPVPAWKTTQQLIDEGYIDMANIPDMDTICAPNTIQALKDAQAELPGSPVMEPKRIPLPEALQFVSPWKPWVGYPLWKILLMDSRPPDRGYIAWAANRKPGSEMQGACLSIMENLDQVNDTLQALAAQGIIDLPTFLASGKAQRQTIRRTIGGIPTPTVAPDTQMAATPPPVPSAPPTSPIPMTAPPTPVRSAAPPPAASPVAPPSPVAQPTRPVEGAQSHTSAPPPAAVSPTTEVPAAQVEQPDTDLAAAIAKWQAMAQGDTPVAPAQAPASDNESAVRIVRIRQLLKQLAGIGMAIGTDQAVQMELIQELTGKSQSLPNLDVSDLDKIIHSLQMMLKAAQAQQ